MGAMYTCDRNVRSCFENAIHLLSGEIAKLPMKRETVSVVITAAFASATARLYRFLSAPPPVARWPQVGRIDLVLQRHDLDLVFLLVGREIDLDLRRASGRDVQLPDSEVLLVDDGLAVAGHGGPEKAAARVPRPP